VAVRGPPVEAGAVEDVAAAPGAAHLGGAVEVAQADAAPPPLRQRGGGAARRQRVEAHRRGVLLEALGRGAVVAEVAVGVGVVVEAGEAEQAGGEAAQVAEQDEEVQEQLGHLRVPDGEPHQRSCEERAGEGGDGACVGGGCLYNKSREEAERASRRTDRSLKWMMLS
jgi:hypothetical protein